MSDPDDIEDLKRWVKIMNKDHGYGAIYNHETPEDKTVVELSAAEEWRVAMANDFNVIVSSPQPNPDDPPDCHVVVEGCRLGVELVQLIDEEHKRRASREETPYAGQLFVDMQWSHARFVSKIEEIIHKKGEKYAKRQLLIDVLLIHADEPWLVSDQVRGWLLGYQITGHPNIANVFLLLPYETGRGVQHWPLFRLYGELGIRK